TEAPHGGQVGADQQLRPRPRALDHRGQGDGPLGPQRVAQRLVDHQSRGSMKTWIVPPHVRPTANASSSAMPYVTVLGASCSSTDKASVRTAPSTQPPDTDPAASPSSLTAIVAPGSRGPEPSTPTTRATATRLPAARQRSM